MAITIARNLLDLNATSFGHHSGWATGYPASNALMTSSPLLQARSIVPKTSADKVIGIKDTVFHANSKHYLFFDYCNFPQIYLKWEPDNSNPPPKKLTWDPIQHTYKGLFELDIGDPISTNFSIVITPSTTPIADDYYRIGTIAMAVEADVEVFEADAVLPLNYTLPKKHVITSRSPYGQILRTRRVGVLNPLHFTLNLSAQARQNFTGKAVEQVFASISQYPDRILLVDFGLEKWQVYLARHIGDLTGVLSSPVTGEIKFGNLKFEVVI